MGGFSGHVRWAMVVTYVGETTQESPMDTPLPRDRFLYLGFPGVPNSAHKTCDVVVFGPKTSWHETERTIAWTPGVSIIHWGSAPAQIGLCVARGHPLLWSTPQPQPVALLDALARSWCPANGNGAIDERRAQFLVASVEQRAMKLVPEASLEIIVSTSPWGQPFGVTKGGVAPSQPKGWGVFALRTGRMVVGSARPAAARAGHALHIAMHRQSFVAGAFRYGDTYVGASLKWDKPVDNASLLIASMSGVLGDRFLEGTCNKHCL